ncbi:MAG: hypothetical protein HC861_02350 [Rhodospirillaceae bacterium]|nr:hypothetical protein [Rhodospirillaceae bacterium]
MRRIALADTGTAPVAAPEQRTVEAVDPDRRMIDNSLAATAPDEISNQDI